MHPEIGADACADDERPIASIAIEPATREHRRVVVRERAQHGHAAGITVFELARIMGTSVSMIESYYGTPIDTAHDAILTGLEAVNG